MVNAHRGEIEACLSGTKYKLCLTLGELADLESAFGNEDMLALAERFSTGRISARDAMRIITAGLRGGGNDVDEDAVSTMRADGGAAGFVDIVARLLAATFGSPTGQVAGAVGTGAVGADAVGSGVIGDADEQASEGSRETSPFPGKA